MKTIGIITITVPGSMICQEEIARYGMAQSGDSFTHPPFIVDTLSFSYYKELVARSDWQAMGNLIISRICSLSHLADFIIIPSNTPHYAIEQIRQDSPLPLLSIVDVTSKACMAQNYKRVLVLGTEQTMQGGLYTKPLEEKGITPIVPEIALRKEVDALIYSIIANQNTPAMNQSVAQKIDALNVDAVILGCTELPCVFTNCFTPAALYSSLRTPIVDTTRLLARAAVDYSLI
ncbi:MAG: amino acid racemase [Gammaproteobacteria bacterium]|nr:amino acid racemase [Gammaproteobacteria bacterium]